MLRFPKIGTGAAAGAALFTLGIMSGHAQLAPNGSTTPSVETSRQLDELPIVPRVDIVGTHDVEHLAKQFGPVNLTLTRQIIKVSTVRQQTEGDDIGYVRLTQFNSQTADGGRARSDRGRGGGLDAHRALNDREPERHARLEPRSLAAAGQNPRLL